MCELSATKTQRTKLLMRPTVTFIVKLILVFADAFSALKMCRCDLDATSHCSRSRVLHCSPAGTLRCLCEAGHDVVHPRLLVINSLLQCLLIFSLHSHSLSGSMPCHGSRSFGASFLLCSLDDTFALHSDCVTLSRLSTILSATIHFIVRPLLPSVRRCSWQLLFDFSGGYATNLCLENGRSATM